MCGINGIISKSSLPDTALIRRMNAAIVHRGPDDEGVWTNASVQLGMRRLSIIDLADGHQPMVTPDGRYVLIFNGEIYNYRQLRQQLEAAGFVFRTKSDTEVILQAFWKDGVAAFEKLEGMFALALYDTFSGELILCRDRLGKKPLYYACEDDRLIFASELKSILSVCRNRFTLNSNALAHFFQLSYIPAPQTIYEEIFKLPAASYMRIKPDHSRQICRYWNLPAAISVPPVDDPLSAAQKLRELLTDCVTKRMVADVPLGVLLSGGVDSSIVAGIMARHSDKPIKTFSVANTVKAYDESRKAKSVSARFGTDHTEWVVDPEELCEHLYAAIDTFDEPFCDMAAIPFYIISRKAAGQVKVVLTGDGGDELFGGYTRYLIYRYAAMYRRLPAALRKGVINSLLRAMPTPVAAGPAYNKLRKLAMSAGESDFELYLSMVQLGYSTEDLSSLCGAWLPPAAVVKTVMQAYEELSGATAIKKAQFCDTILGLEGQMLPKVDRASMLASIEVRCPFIDHRMAEFAFSLSDPLKINEKARALKIILRQSFADMFPAGFLDQPKMGFGIPMAGFLRNELAEDLNRYVSDSEVPESLQLNKQFIARAQREHAGGKDRTHLLWPYFVFARWFQKNNQHLKTQALCRPIRDL